MSYEGCTLKNSHVCGNENAEMEAWVLGDHIELEMKIWKTMWE